jgi:hypothetical protein
LHGEPLSSHRIMALSPTARAQPRSLRSSLLRAA